LFSGIRDTGLGFFTGSLGRARVALVVLTAVVFRGGAGFGFEPERAFGCFAIDLTIVFELVRSDLA
jgi:hypothetical protein